MRLKARRGAEVVTLFNVDVEAHCFTLEETDTKHFCLHPAQARSDDPVVRTASHDHRTQTFSVPARTTAVFVGR